MKIQSINNVMPLTTNFNCKKGVITDPLPQTQVSKKDSVSFGYNGRYATEFMRVWREDTSFKSSAMRSFKQMISSAMHEAEFVNQKFKKIMNIGSGISNEAFMRALMDGNYGSERRIMTKRGDVLLTGGKGECLCFYNEDKDYLYTISYGLKSSGRIYKSRSQMSLSSNSGSSSSWIGEDVYHNDCDRRAVKNFIGEIKYYDKNGEERILRSFLADLIGF